MLTVNLAEACCYPFVVGIFRIIMEEEVGKALNGEDSISEDLLLNSGFVRELANAARESENRLPTYLLYFLRNRSPLSVCQKLKRKDV